LGVKNFSLQGYPTTFVESMQKSKQPEVDIFIPCYMDQFGPETGFNMVRILERSGCKVYYNLEQTCCGQPAFNAGYWDSAKEVGEKFLNEFKPGRYVVTPATSCTAAVRTSYSRLFDNSALHNTCKALQKNLYEFTEFYVNILQSPLQDLKFQSRAVWLDTCMGLRDCHIHETPRKILESIAGLEVAEIQEPETCCGFGGFFSVKFEELSVAMAERKVEFALATGAEFLVSNDMGCLMHLDSYIKKNNLPIKPIHLVDLMAKGLR
jgi:L-lactate dehydrogenase complex protein LldE